MPTISFRDNDMYIDDKPVNGDMPNFISKGLSILVPLFAVCTGCAGALGAASGALINMALGYRGFAMYGFAAGVSVGVMGCLVGTSLLALVPLYAVVHGLGKDGRKSH